jgi:hypothetical protein
MPQTVYYAGNPITARLKLGVVPDGTTNATVTVYRPDGTAIATPSISPWEGAAGDEKTAQWYGTDDGYAGSATTVGVADGDWVVVWHVSGKGATTAPKVFNVAPLPGAGTRPAWAPFLSEVAAHVPTLTVDTLTPGGVLLGTFNSRTQPDDGQAFLHLDQAVNTIAGRFGTLPAGTGRLARPVAALRAAASLARAWLRTDDRLTLARDLETLAAAETTALTEAVTAAGGTASTDRPLPQWAFPPPSKYGDMIL